MRSKSTAQLTEITKDYRVFRMANNVFGWLNWPREGSAHCCKQSCQPTRAFSHLVQPDSESASAWARLVSRLQLFCCAEVRLRCTHKLVSKLACFSII